MSTLAATERPGAPSPAVAPPPGNPRFPLFDSLRAIAVLAILVFHVSEVTGEINRPIVGDVLAIFGDVGPIIFFAISGFLLYRPYAAAHASGRRPPRTSRYARRRALRILPGFWVALTVLAIFPGIVGVFSGDWWRYYLFLQSYSSHSVGAGIPSAWSLCVEFAFYCSLPLWALLIRRLLVGRMPWLVSELVPLAGVALVGLAVQVAASRLLVTQLLATSALAQSTWLALGMALAVISVGVELDCWPLMGPIRFVRDHAGVCWLVALACLAGLAAVLHPGGLFGIVLSLRTRQPLSRTLGAAGLTAGLCVFLIAPAVFGDTRRGVPRRVLAWPPLVWLGVISYGIFLYHLTVAELLATHSDPAHFSARGLGLTAGGSALSTIVVTLAALAVSVAIAAASYYVVELPFLRRKEG